MSPASERRDCFGLRRRVKEESESAGSLVSAGGDLDCPLTRVVWGVPSRQLLWQSKLSTSSWHAWTVGRLFRRVS